jgi:hypothetical protein
VDGTVTAGLTLPTYPRSDLAVDAVAAKGAWTRTAVTSRLAGFERFAFYRGNDLLATVDVKHESTGWRVTAAETCLGHEHEPGPFSPTTVS